jgi:predicted outer membrane repeat protein
LRHLTCLAALLWTACDGKDEPSPDGQDDTGTDTDTDTPGVVDPLDADEDGFAEDVDCDDTDASVFPGAPDLCGDDRVTDCDRVSDDGLVTLDGAVGFDSLGDALAAAGSGSELLLCPGAYAGPLQATVAVRLRSHAGPDTTSLVGSEGSVLSVPGGSELVGLTVRDGKNAQHGGGILLTSAGTLTLEGCVVTANEAVHGGGLSLAPGGQAVLVDTEIRDNSATEGGGGVEVGPGGSLELGEGASVTGNSARWFGGGVWLDGASLTGGVVSGNEVKQELVELFEDYAYYGLYGMTAAGGGGVATSGSASVVGTEVAGNLGDGAGISVTAGEATLVDVSVHGNQGQLGGGLLAAGAIVSLEGSTELAENSAIWGGGAVAYSADLVGGVLRDNSATDEGGGAYLVNGSLSGATVLGNDSDGGGGVYSQGHSRLEGVVLTGNLAWEGGGISTTSSSNDPSEQQLDVLDCTIEGNQADDGGAVYANSNVSLFDTVVSDNIADDLGGGLRLYTPQSEGGGPGDLPPTVTVTGGALLRNTAADGGGAHISFGLLTVEGTDLGEGPDDNTPSDISTEGLPFSGYGAGATFSCDSGGCDPAP